MTVESVARGPKGNLHFLTGVHELCECSFILLFLGATEAEVCDVLGIAAAFADKEGGHRHSSDDICHPCKVPVVQDFGESDMENEWKEVTGRRYAFWELGNAIIKGFEGPLVLNNTAE